MLTQIYEVTTSEEASAISAIGVDHVGILIGDGQFPRELPVAAATKIASAIVAPSKFSALFLTADVARIASWAHALKPAIVHLGASAELLSPKEVILLKRMLPATPIMRSVPVFGEESVAIARGYVDVADFLLLDSYRPADKQIGALGLTHDWDISRLAAVDRQMQLPQQLVRLMVAMLARFLRQVAEGVPPPAVPIAAASLLLGAAQLLIPQLQTTEVGAPQMQPPLLRVDPVILATPPPPPPPPRQMEDWRTQLPRRPAGVVAEMRLRLPVPSAQRVPQMLPRPAEPVGRDPVIFRPELLEASLTQMPA
jgi:phosphoribosylanthranilate isomerase